jgi:hypothetical protein
MLKRTIAAAIAMGASIGTAAAQGCVTPDNLIGKVTATRPDAKITIVIGTAAEALAAAIAEDIQVDIPRPAELFIVFDDTGLPVAALVQFAGGCAIRQGGFDSARMRAWLEELSAEGAR